MIILNYKSFLNEKLNYSLESKLTIENGMVKLWHYSVHNITNGVVSIDQPNGLYSTSEFKAWGRKRAFFYGTEDGYAFDKLPSTNYKYICYIPLEKIYDINYNPNNYTEVTYEEEYIESSEDGYTAWSYYLGNNEEVPIVISFKDVTISESYEKSPGGLYIEKDKELLDYKIGNINVNGVDMIIMQKDGYIKNLTNTYLTEEDEPKEAMSSYKGTLHQYMWSDVNILPEYIEDYSKELKEEDLYF